jgi:hypothetical protein
MPIPSSQELIAWLSEIPTLERSDRVFMVETALYMPDGRIAAFYIGTMIRKSTEAEIEQLLVRIFTGPPYTGGRMKDWLHFRPTGLPPPAEPCEPEQGWVCTVSEDDPWRPEWLRPFPPFPPRPS